MQDSNQSGAPAPPLAARLGAEVVLGGLVGLLSILTAVVAYQSTLLSSQAGGQEVAAVKTLTESNTEFLRANQDIILDYRLYDSFFLNQDVDDFAADYYRDNFSPALTDSLDRPDGPFDDAYYDDQYGEADDTYEAALDLFDQAALVGDRADRLQQVVLVLAVGLSFAAWASLATEGSRIRLIFTLLASLALATGVLGYVLVNGGGN